MSEQRWWLSGAIAFHLMVITVVAVPPPDDLNGLQPVRDLTASPLQRLLTPPLDAVARIEATLEPELYSVLGPLRFVAKPYVAAGIFQKWNMFANPGQDDIYLRVDYYVAAAASRGLSVHHELVFPAQREDQPR